MIQRFGWWFVESWRQILLVTLVSLGILFLLTFQLGSLVPGLSVNEVKFVQSADSGKDIIDNPLFFPQKIMVYSLIKVGLDSSAFVRLPSVVLAFAASVCLFLILRNWYTKRIAILGCGLLCTSSWLLGTGRLALSDASYLMLLPVLWFCFLLFTTRRTTTVWLLLSLLAAFSLYIPGALWFIVLILLWKSPSVWRVSKDIKWWIKVIGGLLFLLVLTPLIWSMVQQPDTILTSLGLPENVNALMHIPLEALYVIKHLVLIAPFDPEHTIGRLPLLDVFTAAMVGLGLYNLRFQLKLARAQLQMAVLLLLWLLVAGGGVNIVALLPIVYVLAAGGIAFLLKQWVTVFPRNPIAQTVGTTLLSLCVVLVSFYHINRYFIAWPQTPATRITFRHSLVQ